MNSRLLIRGSLQRESSLQSPNENSRNVFRARNPFSQSQAAEIVCMITDTSRSRANLSLNQ